MNQSTHLPAGPFGTPSQIRDCIEQANVAASYLERGLGMAGALDHAGDVAAFAAGRSAAISWIVAWERETRAVPEAVDDFDDAVTDRHWSTIVGFEIGEQRGPSRSA
jgi:hypothetical protein